MASALTSLLLKQCAPFLEDFHTLIHFPSPVQAVVASARSQTTHREMGRIEGHAHH